MIYEIGFEVRVRNDHFEKKQHYFMKSFQIYANNMSDAVNKGYEYVKTYCYKNYFDFDLLTFAAEEVNNYGD